MSEAPSCWCGNNDLSPFSPDYFRCAACETLVSKRIPSAGELRSFYGEHYFERMEKTCGLPSLDARARTDLPERCLYWLRGLLKYKLPPARVLELGCAHGAFTALLQWAGFDATGLDMSVSDIELARQRFNIPVLLGPVESQPIPPASLDVIVCMDVLEHLRDPMGTLRHCVGLLKPDGIVFFQTPQYREGNSLEQMQADQDPFVQLLKPDQHLYLFSKFSASILLRKIGLTEIHFEPAIFSFYDMAVAASRVAMAPVAREEAVRALESQPKSRAVLALLDLDDRLADLQNIHALGKLLAESETRRTAPLENISAAAGQGSKVQRQLQAREVLLDRVRQSHVFRLMRKLGLWEWLEPESPVPAIPRRSKNKRGLARIVVDLTPVLPGLENGGAKIMTVELIRHLAKAAPKCELVLLTSEKSHEELAALDAPNVRRLCVNNPGGVLKVSDNLAIRGRRLLTRLVPSAALGKLAGAYREIIGQISSGSSLLEHLDADLLFCPFTAPFFFHRSVPAVSVIYDLQHVYYPQFFEPREIEERGRNIRQAVRLASKLVCISDYVRHTVLENTLALPERVETIHILLPHRLQSPAPALRERVLAKLTLTPERFLLYPANFWPHKNHELLLTAFGMYRSQNPGSGLKLVLTGAPGPRRDELIEAARRMGLAGAVVFPGALPDDEFGVVMYACSAVIFPSLFEGFGMPLLEAMAAGVPILSSNRTSLPEVAGDAALFFDPRKPAEIVDAITRIEHEPELRRSLAGKSAQRLSAFGGPEVMAAQYLRVFQEVAGVRCEPNPPAIYGALEEGGS